MISMIRTMKTIVDVAQVVCSCTVSGMKPSSCRSCTSLLMSAILSSLGHLPVSILFFSKKRMCCHKDDNVCMVTRWRATRAGGRQRGEQFWKHWRRNRSAARLSPQAESLAPTPSLPPPHSSVTEWMQPASFYCPPMKKHPVALKAAPSNIL